MGIFEEVLNKIDGGRVLDVATHEGGFVHILKDNLQSYTQIIGIDINVQAIVKAHNSIGNKQIKFMVMNAEQLNFANNSFDTVSISASLHHLTDIRQVLTEMMRVLKTWRKFHRCRNASRWANRSRTYYDFFTPLGGFSRYCAGQHP